ncbi:MAG: two pore domain potassium channel family protein [Polyangiaceae bacterium]|nr:two pore domain potassium channel family protein [Polyangiaceae bacterium]
MDKRTESTLALLALGAAAAPEIFSVDRVKREILTRGREAPMDAALSMIAAGALLFYLAEKEVNPRVNSLGDAFVFVSTCMSVGYSDIFAKTEAGKAIATVVMTFGPALAATMFDRAPPAVEGG